MDLSVDKYRSDDNRPSPYAGVLQTLLRIILRPIRFFKLTEAEESKAGIYLGGEGRDESLDHDDSITHLTQTSISIYSIKQLRR